MQTLKRQHKYPLKYQISGTYVDFYFWTLIFKCNTYKFWYFNIIFRNLKQIQHNIRTKYLATVLRDFTHAWSMKAERHGQFFQQLHSVTTNLHFHHPFFSLKKNMIKIRCPGDTVWKANVNVWLCVSFVVDSCLGHQIGNILFEIINTSAHII